jgi:hypothetical protein
MGDRHVLHYRGTAHPSSLRWVPQGREHAKQFFLFLIANEFRPEDPITRAASAKTEGGSVYTLARSEHGGDR